MSRYIKTVVCVCGMSLAVACGTAAAEPLKIGISFQEMNNPYFVTMKEEAEAMAALLGKGTALYISDARHDISKQVNDIEDMVQKGINLLIINPTDSEGMRSVVEATRKKGIPVIAVDAEAPGANIFVGSKNYDAGKLACEALIKEIGGKGEVGIMDGIATDGILNRMRGCKDALAEAPDVKLVSVQNGRQERSVAIGVAENMLQANPNIKGIFSVNDGGSMGVLAAIEGSGRKVVLTSVDGAPEAIEAILTGGPFKATAAQSPRDQLRIGIAIGIAAVAGAKLPEEIPVDVKLVDISNAKGFAW